MSKKIVLDSDAGYILYQKPMTKAEARAFVCEAVPQLMKTHMAKLPPGLQAHIASEIDHLFAREIGCTYHPNRSRLLYACDILDQRGFKKKSVPVDDIPAELLERCVRAKW